MDNEVRSRDSISLSGPEGRGTRIDVRAPHARHCTISSWNIAWLDSGIVPQLEEHCMIELRNCNKSSRNSLAWFTGIVPNITGHLELVYRKALAYASVLDKSSLVAYLPFWLGALFKLRGVGIVGIYYQLCRPSSVLNVPWPPYLSYSSLSNFSRMIWPDYQGSPPNLFCIDLIKEEVTWVLACIANIKSCDWPLK